MESDNIVEEDLGKEDPEENVPDLVLPPVPDEGDDWHFGQPPVQGFEAHGHLHGQAGWIEDDDPMNGVDVGEDGPHDSDMGEVTMTWEWTDHMTPWSGRTTWTESESETED